MNILITGIGGPTPRSIASSIRRKNPEANIVGVDCEPRALGFYMPGLLSKWHVVPRADREKEYFEAIWQIIRDDQIECAIVQPESEVQAWGEYFEAQERYPCPAVIPPAAYTRALVNKAAMADVLDGTGYIPKTVRISPSDPRKEEVRDEVGYPCWIRASVGSGGLGSLKLNCEKDLDAWLLIHSEVREFTVSEFLPGKHLANQMLYLEGELQLNAGLECVDYVMADVAPSRVTGNTSYGRLINDNHLLAFCEEVIEYIAEKLDIRPHGVFSFDLKLDAAGQPKVTEINIRHMAYTGILAQCGSDFIEASLDYLRTGTVADEPVRYQFPENYVFLRDVDIEPIVLTEAEIKA